VQGTMNEDIMLEKRLDFLRAKHHELDEMINTSAMDEFTKMRLKKEKLAMRDQIMQIEAIVYPDVIA
jgi:hypothetical protein